MTIHAAVRYLLRGDVVAGIIEIGRQAAQGEARLGEVAELRAAEAGRSTPAHGSPAALAPVALIPGSDETVCLGRRSRPETNSGY